MSENEEPTGAELLLLEPEIVAWLGEYRRPQRDGLTRGGLTPGGLTPDELDDDDPPWAA
jgi:hypothetical protein